MRTLIVSDLHLGSASGADVLRRPELRGPLLQAAREVDRLVLLGDTLELRHGPPREALAVARPLLEELGAALDGRELVLVAGNHDHALIEPWLAMRAAEPDPQPLTLEHLIEPQEASPLLARMSAWAQGARVRVAYPGLWVRADTYATHGHYLDCHLTVPTLERLSAGAMSKLMGRPASEFDGVADYEAVTAPMYAWRDAVARDGPTGAALNGLTTVRAWRMLGGGGGGRAALRARAGDGGADANARDAPDGAGRLSGRLARRAAASAFPLAVALLNRVGLGPLRAEISGSELRRAGLAAMGEVAARIGLGDAYVIFGHTHRAGPLPRDRPEEWRPRAGAARLINAGCWTYQSAFLGGRDGESPYWPGACVLVEDSGAPAVRLLLSDRTRVQIAPERPRTATAGRHSR